MSILKGRLGAVYASYGYSYSASGEACELDTGTTYKVTDITKRYWDPTYALTIYENGVESTKAYTIQYPGGRIVFPSDPTPPVTADFYYIYTARVAGFQNWSIDSLGMDIVDVSEFGDIWRLRETLIGDFTASAERYWIDDSYANPSSTGEDLVFIFYDLLDITTKITPWGDGNFELDLNSDGIADGWSAHSDGTPTGARSLEAGGFAGAKCQRLTVTAASLDDEYGIEYDGLGNAASGDQVAVEFRYKSANTSGLVIKARIGSTGGAASFAASTSWARALTKREFSGTTDMDVYIFLEASGAFSGDADLDIDFVRAIHLPSGNSQKRWEGYGRVGPDTISAPHNELIREALSISGNGEIYYRTDKVVL